MVVWLVRGFREVEESVVELWIRWDFLMDKHQRVFLKVEQWFLFLFWKTKEEYNYS
jgi:hypothetical protein